MTIFIPIDTIIIICYYYHARKQYNHTDTTLTITPWKGQAATLTDSGIIAPEPPHVHEG